MLKYQEFLAINEEFPYYNPNERLRDCVHEILSRLKDTEKITFSELSIILKKDFKINIPENLLKTIFSKWDAFTNADYSVFKKEDKEWLDVWMHQNYIKRKTQPAPVLGKHKRRLSSPSTSTGYWKRNRWIDTSKKDGTTPEQYPNYYSGYGYGWD